MHAPFHSTEETKESPMSTFDVYGMTDKLNHTLLNVIVTRLEARGKHPLF